MLVLEEITKNTRTVDLEPSGEARGLDAIEVNDRLPVLYCWRRK